MQVFRLGTKAVLAAVLFCLPVSAGAATSYYVSASGSDDNAGTSPDDAFASIVKAATVAAAGDTVRIAPGTYAGRIRPTHSGAAGEPITYRRDGEGEVVITTTPATDDVGWYETFAVKLGAGINYTTLEGLTFRDAKSWVYIGDGAHHNKIVNCRFDGCRMYHGILISNSSFNRITGCSFVRATHFPEDFPISWRGGNLADYIAIWRNSHRNVVEDSTFGAITHVGVTIMGMEPECVATRNIVQRCVFADPLWKCVSTHSSEFTVVQDCTMTGQATAFFQLAGARTIVRRNTFAGLRLVRPEDIPLGFCGAIWFKGAVSEYGSPDLAAFSRIYNNVFYGNDRTVSWTPHRGGVLPVVNNVFKNNIFYRNKQTIALPLPFYRSFSTQLANPVVNNLIVSADPDTPPIELVSPKQTERLTIQQAPAKTLELCRRETFGDNSAGDPQFVNAEAGDFRLKAGSPCIDAGAALTVTIAAGQGDEIRVADATYFCDGFGVIAGDKIVVGANRPAKLLNVDYDLGVLTLDRSITWAKGDPVNLPFSGKAPDIGANESK